MRLELGTPVRCSDGKLGKLADVVVDPRAGRVTHLVVETGRLSRTPRLAPLELVDDAGDHEEVVLRCTVKEARALESAEGFACLRPGEVEFDHDDQRWDVGIERVLVPPAYPEGDLAGYESASFDGTVSLVYDRVPKGEVEIRRGSAVVGADDRVVGAVEAVVVDGSNRITHVVVTRGHFWNRRHVSVSMNAVTRVETDTVTTTLSRDEFDALDGVRAGRWLV
ncbi:MAG TPA: PRC-barrel domain-containing protein [Thermoleophilaceae bacterium]|nr:PRC-barrel domain-containing protein [Thermoleophilaceae bacterium]